MIRSASQYHQRTCYERGKLGGHYLDRRNQPVVFKDYPGVDPLPLPSDTKPVSGKVSSVPKEEPAQDTTRSMSIKDLSQILQLTYGLTAKTTHSGGEFYYRSAASAGALYPIEIYVATYGVKDLDDGLYHFAIHRHGLSPLRSHDISGYIARLISPAAEKIPTIIFIMY